MKGLLFLFLFVSTVTLGQLKCCFSFSPTTDTTIHDVSFANKIWNVDSNRLVNNRWKVVRDSLYWSGTAQGGKARGHITVPYGYVTPSWQIIQHRTFTVVASGVGSNPSATLFYNGPDSLNTYALYVYTTRVGLNPANGLPWPAYPWISPGEFTVYPEAFNEGQANTVIDLSVSFNNSASNFTDFSSGRKIFVKGTAPGPNTSATSKNLTGLTSPQTWVTQTGLSWTSGRLIKVASSAAPNTDYVYGTVSSYNSGTGDMAVTWTGGNLFGSGAHTDWMIQLREEFNIFYWNSTGKPIHFIFSNASITSASYLWKIGENHRIILDGVTNHLDYGLKLYKATGGIFECVYVTPADGAHDSHGWQWGGLYVDNGVRATQGGTGWVVQMVNGAFNDTNSSFHHIVAHDIYVTNTTNEGFYWGHTNPGSVPEYIKSSFVLMYRLTANHTQNEGIQMAGMKKSELFKSSFQDTGVGGSGGQNYNIQQSSENDGLTWYMNQGLTTLGLFQAKTGPKGGSVEVFANVFESTAADGTNANFWHLDNNSKYSTLYCGVAFNTFRLSTGTVFQLWNDTGFGTPSVFWTFLADLNVIVTNTSTQATYNNGYNSSLTIMNNKQYTSTATPLFVDVAAKDYRPRSLSSPMGNSTPNSTAVAARIHPWFEFGFDGAKRNPLNIFAGAYAGLSLMTHGGAPPPPPSPVAFKVNFFTGTATGWFPTGASTPAGGGLGTVDYGEIIIDGVGTGVGIRAINPSSGTRWTGTLSSGGTGATIVPDAVQATMWYTDQALGSEFELYEIVAGTLTAHSSYTVKLYGSRSGVAGPRTVQYSSESGQTGTVNVAPIAGNDNNAWVTLTGVTVIGGVIKIKVKTTTPTDSATGYINGMDVASE